MLNLLYVRSFLAVVEAGSFGVASAGLGLAQPTVSQHLQKLEAALGARLIARQRQGCAATPQGEAFLPLARSLLALAERAQQKVRSHALAIGASSNIGTYLLQPYLKALRAHAGEDLKVDVWIGQNPEVADKLERREIDIAVMEWWDGRPGFVSTTWREENMVVIVPPSHPWARSGAVTRQALSLQPLIGGEAGTGTGRLLNRVFGPRAGALKVDLQLGSTEAVKQAVKVGLGVSLVLESAVREEVRSGTLVALPLVDAVLKKSLQVVQGEDDVPDGASALFARLLLDDGGKTVAPA